MKALFGLHHITAIAGDARQNFDFYTRVLGLRLVKKTVNFDDPNSYHFYYGTTHGAPGTILTFFAWRGATPGRIGNGEIKTTALSVPRGSLGFWRERFQSENVTHEPSFTRFGDEVLTFFDCDHLRLELVESDDNRQPWQNDIPFEYSIRGLHSATIAARERAQNADVLQNVMGFRFVGEESGRARFALGEQSGDNSATTFLDVTQADTLRRGQMGAGTVHHVAFRASDDETQKSWREALSRQGFDISPIMDRSYFRSIYFREPGGVLFEIATDAPGFEIDEDLETLGQSLKLPPAIRKRSRAHRASFAVVVVMKGCVSIAPQKHKEHGEHQKRDKASG